MNKLSLSVFFVVLLLAGCASQPMQPVTDPHYAPVMPIEPPAPQSTNGAIYQAGYGISLYKDVTARRVGDVLTIQLVEQTQASKQASTSTSKDQTIDMSAGILLGAPVLHNGNPILQNSISGNRTFKGDGASSQKNSLSGNITVTVAEVLRNGNLVVRGEKLLTLNQGDEYIRISGIVRPVDVAPDNTVLSTRVANAQITYSGRGALAEANQKGWLARFFSSPLWPF